MPLEEVAGYVCQEVAIGNGISREAFPLINVCLLHFLIYLSILFKNVIKFLYIFLTNFVEGNGIFVAACPCHALFLQVPDNTVIVE